jgi:transcriptional regulator with XRE-family HTH domain
MNEPTPSNPSVPETEGTPQQALSNARVKKSSKALRRLREALGHTQEYMADELGLSAITIRAIEGGRRGVTQRTAELAQAKFGVFAESLLGDHEEPMTLLGERVSRESLDRSRPDIGTQRVSENEVAAFTSPLMMLLNAAAHQGKLLPLGVCYKKALQKLADELGLEGQLGEEATHFYKKPVFRHYTRKELRQRPEVAEALGIEDDPDAPDTQRVKVQSVVDRKVRHWLHAARSFPEYRRFIGSEGEQRFVDLSGSAKGK